MFTATANRRFGAFRLHLKLHFIFYELTHLVIYLDASRLTSTNLRVQPLPPGETPAAHRRTPSLSYLSDRTRTSLGLRLRLQTILPSLHRSRPIARNLPTLRTSSPGP